MLRLSPLNPFEGVFILWKLHIYDGIYRNIYSLKQRNIYGTMGMARGDKNVKI
jgi:hypothetical protein